MLNIRPVWKADELKRFGSNSSSTLPKVPRVRTLARNAFFPFELLGLTGVKENAIRSPDPSREVDILTFRFRTIDLFSRKNGLNKVVISTFRLATMTNRQRMDRQWKVVILTSVHTTREVKVDGGDFDERHGVDFSAGAVRSEWAIETGYHGKRDFAYCVVDAPSN